MKQWLRRLAYYAIGAGMAIILAVCINTAAFATEISPEPIDGYIVNGTAFKMMTKADGTIVDVQLPKEMEILIYMKYADAAEPTCSGTVEIVAWLDEETRTEYQLYMAAAGPDCCIGALIWYDDGTSKAWVYDYVDPIKFNKDPVPLAAGADGMEKWLTIYEAFVFNGGYIQKEEEKKIEI